MRLLSTAQQGLSHINRGKIAENKPTLDQPKPDASLRPIEKRNKTERKADST